MDNSIINPRTINEKQKNSIPFQWNGTTTAFNSTISRSDEDNIVVVENDKMILKGQSDIASTLWMIPIKHHKKAKILAHEQPSVPLIHAVNSAYHHTNLL